MNDAEEGKTDMKAIYLIQHSDEEGTYTKLMAFESEELAEDAIIKLLEECPYYDYFVTPVPFYEIGGQVFVNQRNR